MNEIKSLINKLKNLLEYELDEEALLIFKRINELLEEETADSESPLLGDERRDYYRGSYDR